MDVISPTAPSAHPTQPKPTGVGPMRRGPRRMTQSMTVPGEGPNIAQDSRSIPIADVPVQPILSGAALSSGGATSVPSLLDNGQPLFVTAGRIAIALGLELTGIKPGDGVLVPAFHCASMISPLSWVSAHPIFYRVQEDLQVDLADMESKVDERTKAVLAPHYFGFQQDMAALQAFCRARDLILIEDCAHSFFGAQRGQPVGAYGDFAIGSLTKFFAVRDGGCLVLNRPLTNSPLQKRQSRWQDVRAIFDSVEDANYYGRLAALAPVVAAAKSARWALGAMTGRHGPNEEADSSRINPAQQRSGAQEEFQEEWIHVRPTRVSEAVCRRSIGQRIIERRIHHFRRLAAAFSSVPGCRPLFRTVPDGAVPHMFPLYIDDLQRTFPRLEDLAVPMQRFGQFLWTGVEQSTCPVSADLSHHLIQLPCHQELSDAELDWVVATVFEALAR